MPITNFNPIARPRNTAVQIFLKNDYDYLWFIDSDVLPSPDAPRLLLEAGKAVIGGMYYCVVSSEADPHTKRIIPGVSRLNNHGDLEYVPSGDGIEEVHMVATGCMMIQREILEKMDPPWFEDRFWGPFISDDVIFCERLRNQGTPIYVHWDVKCSHRKDIDLALVRSL
jgi:GT2 family glycosyltransferase